MDDESDNEDDEGNGGSGGVGSGIGWFINKFTCTMGADGAGLEVASVLRFKDCIVVSVGTVAAAVVAVGARCVGMVIALLLHI